MNGDVRHFLEDSREFFRSGGFPDAARRLEDLRRLRRTLKRCREELLSALYHDLHKSRWEALLTEYVPLMTEIRYLERHLKGYMAVRRVPLAWWNWPGRGSLEPEPLGVVLMGQAWNYPLLLAMSPLAGAVSAGCRVLLRLSGRAPATGAILEKVCREAFPAGQVLADRRTPWEELLKERFDKIFFTGSPERGRGILRAAAEFLTPATLELGGKNPCIVLADADLKTAARRIVWGKFLNAGQSCIAPDYVLADRRIKTALIGQMREAIRLFYGDDPRNSGVYARLVSSGAYDRVAGLMESGRLAAGGEKDPSELYVAPTILEDVQRTDPVMTSEIFGPVLPVLEIASLEDAVAWINGTEKPLAIYAFTANRSARRRLRQCTRSGALVFNDVMSHFGNLSMPFGGVGASGMGCYRGKASFDTFSHYRSVMSKGAFPDWPLRYPRCATLLQKLMEFFF